MRHRSAVLPLIAALAAVLLAAGLPVPPAVAAAHAAARANLAAGKPVTASSTQPGYPAGNATDGDQGSYWESASGAFPQWIQVDLGRAAEVTELVLRLPAHWESRTQTIEVRGSTDGASFTRLAAPAARLFNPSATITFDAATVRHIRLEITANTGWPAGQLAELEVYGPGQDPDPGPGDGADLALGKPIEASSHTWIYVPGNANDGDVTTYWEGDGLPEHAHRRARRERRPQLDRAQAQPRPGLGAAHPDHRGARPPPERRLVHHAGPGHRLHLRPRHRQHRDASR